MSRNPPFAKKTPSQSQRPEFYWRGGPTLKEKEYLVDEYKKAYADFQKAQFELKAIEQELQKTNESLYERESYTTALASCLDNDAEGSKQEHDYKKKFAELEVSIKNAEQELQEVKSVHHPAVISGLLKEKAYLTIEIQRQSKALTLRDEAIEMNKKQLAALVISTKYQNAMQLENQVEKLQRKRTFLRSQVNKKKREFDLATSSNTPLNIDPRIKEQLVNLTELNMLKERGKEREQRRVNKWNAEARQLIDYIYELNMRMKDLKIEDGIVDITKLEEKYIIKSNRDGQDTGGRDEQ